jgi:hypothetical protein
MLSSHSFHLRPHGLFYINEASDNFSGFGSAAGLTINGTNRINTYTKGCLAKIAKIDTRIPLMLQDCFQGKEFWSPFYASGPTS